MPPVQRRQRSWLGPIHLLLQLMLVADILALPILLLPHNVTHFGGSIHVGSVTVGDIFAGDPYVHRKFPQLREEDVTVIDDSGNYVHFLLGSINHRLASTIATIPMLWFAARLIRRARDGDPFTLEMVRGMRRLGFLVLIGGALSEAAEYLAGRILLDLVLPHDEMLRSWAQLDHYPTLWWLIPGLVVLGFSEIVKRGVDLRAELDGVI